jgi:farnesyl-diphosphate farnesyltransferase
MRAELERDVLKGVSRSFYLSLRLLPAPMRRPAGIAYLLARTSDTIADSAQIPAAERSALLDRMALQISGGQEAGPFPRKLVEAAPDPRERALLDRYREIISAMNGMEPAVLGHVRRVVSIIIGGQKLDLERFGDTVSGEAVPLATEADLDDYTWRVAGCVGEFWTKLGFETLGCGFSKIPPDELAALGIDFGKGLQLVNILRDLPNDLRMGRCYLPANDPTDREEMMRLFRKWLAVASQRMGSGIAYSSGLHSKRLRMASSLPALIGRETIARMDGAGWDELEAGVKIPRSRVYCLVMRSLIFR